MIKINQKIPDFELDGYYKDKIKKIKLSAYKGKWLLVLFYPSDFTFICPTELEEAAEHYKEFQKLGAEILSVSTDTAFAHKAWHDRSLAVKKIKFPMLADPTGKLCREFGTYIEEEGLSLRASFIIAPNGELKAYEMHTNDIGRSIKELLRKLQAAKFVNEHKGLVCPASWEPGKKTLKPGLNLVGKI
ncbi:MAG: peroxiredoxin [Candidatus Portnoybacteria bacterium RIFCSPLOWO2_01_FULL_43_11]|uniref:Peroxiredoxin n=3 Tax=Candidatus Portnoyibacteriota TaxID=1817913 RepID=A0A1G2FA48_9BACT|nr:MAG: peroxiredoxin [Candidatus Portnoybacteria bacterium RIFCSPHIGHO2_01_FULL_40_12b]OGZ36850.1 MAG: peroxiredoxin [Candidatus Portnoybacteria bacterium RIFCSPHIGHO2_02_FULL_40_23]OGZ38242.1 MAG: peroxiredoxin [Candidatus Portnoybacteria bacterium RIFCSPLOWO2_01_FULL_43_11]OGZ39232.1 MAG: peroxiredoxin [Candidatus Portnoybacteria bacterium RIFCSPHIGHO2_12_FULL_40_11]